VRERRGAGGARLTGLDVAVQDPVVVQVLDAAQQLQHERLDLACEGAAGWRAVQPSQGCETHRPGSAGAGAPWSPSGSSGRAPRSPSPGRSCPCCCPRRSPATTSCVRGRGAQTSGETQTRTRTLTTLGCWPALSSMLISRSEVIGKPSFSFSILSRLSATTWPVRFSTAR